MGKNGGINTWGFFWGRKAIKKECRSERAKRIKNRSQRVRAMIYFMYEYDKE